MKIKLKNIGIIKESELCLDGLTIITGKNNSGKTTVGKVIYSTIDAVSDLQHKSEIDKENYIIKQFAKVRSMLDILQLFFYDEKTLEVIEKYTNICDLLHHDLELGICQENNEVIANKLCDELKKLGTEIYKNPKMMEKKLLELLQNRFIENEKNYVENSVLFPIKQAIVTLKQMINEINKDKKLINYARESINQTLKVEFSNQIQPVIRKVEKSNIEIFDDKGLCFSFNIENNSVIDEGKPVFFNTPYKKTFFIDDPFILDSQLKRRTIQRNRSLEMDSILNVNRLVPHNSKLLRELKGDNYLSIFEKTILSDSLKKVMSCIDSILPGTFEFSSEGDYYVINGSKLKLTNLATGSKMFSIIKILLEKGLLNEETMLILDEPEAHLHPMWQNVFAEIIVLLVKELHVNVLLTTHSPNFVLALDANMRKYEISDVTNFYQTTQLDDGFVSYKCVNDNIGFIYEDFAKYLSMVKMLRDKYYDIMGDLND